MIRLRRSVTAAAVLTLGAVLGAVLGVAAPASAHITVNPNEADQGGYARLAFRVPNESDEASTTKVEVFFPEDAPVASVTTMPVPGWTVAVEKRAVNPPLEVHGSQVTEAVAKITWTASSDDTGVQPGEFQEFPVSAGPLPEVDRMVFRALQTYSDGNVVRWIDPPAAAGGEEPASPAPVLTLAAAPAEGTPTAGPSVEAVPASSTDDGGSNAWGIAGLVAGLAGLVLGGLAYARTRRPAAPPAA
ncbi:YcnI family copper-binding membrane protein [Polymorphospora rubra]|uniref:YcnI family copper-binding membrane protein n=1 Tax=Polymorphospora rubra TaxID=338584 RepID=UPI0033FAD675